MAEALYSHMAVLSRIFFFLLSLSLSISFSLSLSLSFLYLITHVPTGRICIELVISSTREHSFNADLPTGITYRVLRKINK